MGTGKFRNPAHSQGEHFCICTKQNWLQACSRCHSTFKLVILLVHRITMFLWKLYSRYTDNFQISWAKLSSAALTIHVCWDIHGIKRTQRWLEMFQPLVKIETRKTAEQSSAAPQLVSPPCWAQPWWIRAARSVSFITIGASWDHCGKGSSALPL